MPRVGEPSARMLDLHITWFHDSCSWQLQSHVPDYLPEFSFVEYREIKDLAYLQANQELPHIPSEAGRGWVRGGVRCGTETKDRLCLEYQHLCQFLLPQFPQSDAQRAA